ncbi:MAG: ComEC/Rec2 family competence protein [Chloroflexi bacterium]|nr:ComEC/Rec2 family competence protein [Chloroflexota bacterium]
MPLLFVAAAFLAGVFMASTWQPATLVEMGGLGVAVAALVASRWIGGFRLPAVMLLALVVGVWRYDAAVEASGSSPALAAEVDRGMVELRGVVDAPPEVHELRQNVRLRLAAMGEAGRWEAAQGTVLLYAAITPKLAYGDSLEVAGELEYPLVFEGFDYRGYLGLQGIQYVMQRPKVRLLGQGQGFPPLAWMHRLRGRLSDVLGSTLPEPEASIGQGVLLGSRSAIPGYLAQAFAVTGTTHILAISGYNITLIAAAIFAVATRFFGRNRATYVAALGIGLYAILAGASPSVLRAAVMGVLVIVAYRLGRQNVVLNALAVSAAGLVLAQPFWLWDASFQLSFLSTIGLIFLARPLAAALLEAASRTGVLSIPLLGKAAGLLAESVAITLAATIYTLPLAAFSFHQISLVTLVANLFAVPSLPPIIAVSAAIAAVGLIYLPLAQLVAYASWPIIAYLVGVVGLFAGVPGAAVAQPPFSPALVWGCYGLLAVLTLALHLGWSGLGALWQGLAAGWQSVGQGLAGFGSSRFVGWAILPALIVAVAAWAVALSLPDDRLQVTFLDVGQGDAILIKTPGNRKLLVDGGPSPQRLLDQLGTGLPFWDRTVDVLILSHPHEDHLAGLLGVLERYDVHLVLESPISRPGATYRGWEEEIARRGTRRQVLGPEDRLKIGDLEVTPVFVPAARAPSRRGGSDEQPNDSLVLRLKIGDASFLLPGDTPAEAQAQLLDFAGGLESTILKVPHHGAGDALDPRFLAAIAPRLAVISVGADNPFGHPAPETLALLSSTRTLRTDESGSVQVTTDGKRVWVKTWRRK